MNINTISNTHHLCTQYLNNKETITSHKNVNFATDIKTIQAIYEDF